ncbi:MAG TPA: family 1 glycosylhydrolase [Verrucomicrobiae bacterium]|jgi:beta-glucosidase/6-phospho-beta-glucosidase/beta-galactosidase|nr:family 1 glycosylhydrolase [Verrucomicrobiae bacterium]
MFRSFFFAGFECATGYNAIGEWIDQIAATHHDKHADEDYKRLREVGIAAAREAIRWPLVDKGGGQYDFSAVTPFVEASHNYEIEVIWDLFHYGYPDDLDLFSEEFPRRFADYCHAAAKYICRNSDGICYFTPVNEPSFFAWAGGHVGRFAPHCIGKGVELKRALIRAAIQGINAIRAAIPGVRIVNVDPLCHVVAPKDRPELQKDADWFNDKAVFEAWDMLSGRIMPELGGSRAHLDILGINYYWTNQWELGHDEHPLAEDDPRRVSLRDLVERVYQRYNGDLLITETAHVDDMRPKWMKYVAEEAEAMLQKEIPLHGVCLYPILGMPEWHDQNKWTQMGLWELTQSHAGLERRVCAPMLKALKKAQGIERKFLARSGQR